MHNLSPSTIVVGVAAVLFAAGAATAQTASPNASRNVLAPGSMTIGEIVAKVEKQGYSVREIEIDDGVYEVKATNADGLRVEADLDPSTGEPLRGWKQDD